MNRLIAIIFLILGILYPIHFVNMSTAPQKVNFDEVFSATKNNSVYIIDVREPTEIKDSGSITNSLNIPLNDVEPIFKNYSNDQFKNQFGRPKPNTGTAIIFSCRSGKRANTALEIVEKLGYNNLKLYEGSWLDWEKHTKN